MAEPQPVAFIVQRYGLEVDGGAELHCRWTAERLAARRPVEVITTCAKDYITWRNHYEPGVAELNQVVVRRFPTSRERRRDEFDRFTVELLSRSHSLDEEQQWLDQQGPQCPELLDFLAREWPRYAALIFYTYLYYPTVRGLAIAPQRSILAPTAHDEPVIRFELFRTVFQAPRGLLFLTDAERRFVQETFGNAHIPWKLLGAGIEVGEGEEVEFRAAFGIQQPYLLYVGRVDAGKGCRELAEFFLHYKKRYRDPLELVFLGQVHDAPPSHPAIRATGFTDDRLKAGALRGALAVAASSPFESLGIAPLEAMSVAIPVIVNGRSEVLLDHCRRSNGGLWYNDAEEFTEVVRLLAGNRELRSRMGACGQRYISQFYTWRAVIDTLESAIAELS